MFATHTSEKTIRCVQTGGNAAEMDNAHAEQPPTEIRGNKGRHEVDNSRRNLKCPSLRKVIRNEINARTSTLRASDDVLIVAAEFLGRPHLE